MVKQVMAFLMLALMGLWSVGCAPVSNPRNVTVELDDALRSQLQTHNVEVDIVAVNSTESTDHWQDYSMTKYWQPGDQMRDSVPTYKMILDPTKPGGQTLRADDPIWKKWFDASPNEQYMQLYVLALLPEVIEDAPGAKDPRRLIIPLVDKRWKTAGPNSTIRIKVQADKLVDMTPADPPKS